MKPATAYARQRHDDRQSTGVVGVIKSTYPRPLSVSRAVNDEQFAAAGLDAWARRAASANGFADAAVASAPGSPPDIGMRDITTRDIGVGDEHRASAWMIVRAFGSAIAEAGHAIAQRWRQRLELRRTYQALSSLDERTLCDIGVSEREIGSIAAELAGRAERTRMQSMRTLRELAL